MKSKTYYWIVRGLLVVLLMPLLLVLWAMLEPWAQSVLLPSATEDLLAFAELPRATHLSRPDPNAAAGTDFQPVEARLFQRFPVGTPKAEIEQFVHDRCRVSTERIECFFSNKTYPSYSRWVPCIDEVILTFSFEASGKLLDIQLVGRTLCM
jgi:hypothetical protein